MSVYVDTYRKRWRGMSMSHMMADTLDELHEMADLLKLKRAWFQDNSPAWMPHYDVCEAKALQAVSLGAVRCCPRELVTRFSPRLRDQEAQT